MYIRQPTWTHQRIFAGVLTWCETWITTWKFRYYFSTEIFSCNSPPTDLQRIVARVPNMQWARMLLYMRHRLIISILTGRGSVFTHLAQPIGCLILEKIRQTIFEEDPTLRITIFLYTNHLSRDGKTLYICFRLWSIVDLNISNLRCHIVVS